MSICCTGRLRFARPVSNTIANTEAIKVDPGSQIPAPSSENMTLATYPAITSPHDGARTSSARRSTHRGTKTALENNIPVIPSATQVSQGGPVTGSERMFDGMTIGLKSISTTAPVSHSFDLSRIAALVVARETDAGSALVGDPAGAAARRLVTASTVEGTTATRDIAIEPYIAHRGAPKRIAPKPFQPPDRAKNVATPIVS
jgi:hypothetical protein